MCFSMVAGSDEDADGVAILCGVGRVDGESAHAGIFVQREHAGGIQVTRVLPFGKPWMKTSTMSSVAGVDLRSEGCLPPRPCLHRERGAAAQIDVVDRVNKHILRRRARHGDGQRDVVDVFVVSVFAVVDTVIMWSPSVASSSTVYTQACAGSSVRWVYGVDDRPSSSPSKRSSSSANSEPGCRPSPTTRSEGVFVVRLYDEHFAAAEPVGHAAGVAALGFGVEGGVRVIIVLGSHRSTRC